MRNDESSANRLFQRKPGCPSSYNFLVVAGLAGEPCDVYGDVARRCLSPQNGAAALAPTEERELPGN